MFVGKTEGHIGSSLFEKEILNISSNVNPPNVDLVLEKKNSEFIRNLIENSLIQSCHDISDGGIIVTLFEKCSNKFWNDF